ncbi:MAG: DUF922 domain-containing protein [Chitinophagaceae bacterium]
MVLKLIIAYLLSIPVLFTPGKDNNSIPWLAARKLTWDDFKSSPDDNSTNAALTSSKITFKYTYDSEKGFSYNIGCVFEKNSSWGRVKTDYILSHEQGHFDIAEIYARKLHKIVKSYSFDPSTAQKSVPAMYNKIMKELAEMQNQYDSETDFSRDKEEQEQWGEKVKKELDKLKEYAGYK